ncbi:helix-turn-helix domain-containing protein [Fluviicola chungangensis]|uniref:helix-turn-helix domain-containing protein n=1 Tax=Fluviicola chungangensis TaxID=2597671 RepID=UPI0016432C85|nr:helix-turn-helix transcriptional regulator [Fluviicola chungangensis]
MSNEKERIVIKQISEKIRLRREELAISRSLLASETGLDEKQIRRIENYESTLPIVTLLKICFVLKLDIDFLKKYLEDDSILL